MNETPSSMFNKRLKWLLFLGLISLIIYFFLNRYIISKEQGQFSFIILIVLLSIIGLLISLNYLSFIRNFSKASEDNINKDYINTIKSPWLYIFMLIIGLFSLYLALFKYTPDLPPKPFLIFMGVILIVGMIYGLLKRNDNIEKTLKAKSNPIKFKASRTATVFGAIWLLIADIIYELFNLTWTQGFLLAVAGVIVAIIYYFYLKNK